MTKTSEIVINRLQENKIRYWAGDNISDHLEEGGRAFVVFSETLPYVQHFDGSIPISFLRSSSVWTPTRSFEASLKELEGMPFTRVPTIFRPF